MFVTRPCFLERVMTCRHYRFQLPHEDADELRAADPEPCAVCDNLPRRQIQTVIWSPRVASRTSSPEYGKIQGWLLSLFQHSPAHAKADHGSPASAISSC
jgi:hypothetical protein